MITLEWLGFLLCLPLPWLIRRFLPAAARQLITDN